MTTFPSKSPPPLPSITNHVPTVQYERHQLPQISTGHSNVPPNTNHPSLSATYSHPNALPQIQDWLKEPITNGSERNGSVQSPNQYSPRQAAKQQSGAVSSEPYHPYRNQKRSSTSSSASQQDSRSIPRTLTPSPSPVLRQASPHAANA